MNTKLQNTPATVKKSAFKKSVLSIVVISAITGGLVLLEEIRKEQSKMEFSDQLSRYSIIEKDDTNNPMRFDDFTDENLSIIDVDTLAKQAEKNLLMKSNRMDEKTFIQVNTLEEILPKEEIALEKKSIEIANNNKKKTLLTESVSVKTEVKAENTSVLFALSSSVIAPEYKLALIQIAQKIKSQEENKKWQIVGHTDKSGRASYNLRLSKKRAQNVALFLIEQGVAEAQLTLVTLGEHEAKKLNNSTYNAGLRKVDVVQYQPKLSVLAMKIHKNNERNIKRNAQIKRAHQQKSVASEIITILTTQEKDLEQNTPIREEKAGFILNNDPEENKTNIVSEGMNVEKEHDSDSVEHQPLSGQSSISEKEPLAKSHQDSTTLTFDSRSKQSMITVANDIL